MRAFRDLPSPIRPAPSTRRSTAFVELDASTMARATAVPAPNTTSSITIAMS